jgi:phosphopantothenoylcysteine synthetase/decarboxylase
MATVVVTCGPAWEPIDGMRRLTNASTGGLGRVLAQAFQEAGHRVVMCRGEASTAPPPGPGIEVVPFGTNDQLAARLEELAGRGPVDAVFHAAALCDYRVARILDAAGNAMRAAKVPSRAGALRLELEPATKVLPRLRSLFPRAWLVGWKYELNGDRSAALSASWRQLEEAGTDACVVNGAAWGTGFGVCRRPDQVTPCAGAEELARVLEAAVEGQRPG